MASDPQIERINEISQLARTAWFSLLGYLVFVGITLLGVEDADFFVPSRQTQLPLVNVSIPTASFFVTAPVLGAALYVYLHLFLIKLWEAHAEAGSRAEDPLHNWLVNDFALRLRRDPKVLRRPLGWLTGFTTRALVWLAGPIVLTYAWWRSMPAHNEWLTLLIALCLGLSLLAGFTSWWTAWERLRQRRLDRSSPWRRWWRPPLAAGVGALLLGTSWLRTEGGFAPTTAWVIDQIDRLRGAETRLLQGCEPWGDILGPHLPEIQDCYDKRGKKRAPDEVRAIRIARMVPGDDNRLVRSLRRHFGRWLDDNWLPLAQTDLADDALVPLPPDWRNFQIARRGFREAWCRREGLDMTICDHHSDGDRPSPPHVATARTAYCQANGIAAGDPCPTAFASLDTRFDREWLQERASLRASLPSLDLSRKDLRRMSAPRALLVGADLTGAQMEGADLIRAQMEGAILSGAQMEGAVLSGAQMEGADLIRAQMEEAVLIRAQMEGAILSGAQMEGADLSGAQMERAFLIGAQMEGAILSGAQMEGADLIRAQLRSAKWAGARTGSPAHFADLRGAQELTQDQLDYMIGNAMTLLPETLSDGSVPRLRTCWERKPRFYDSMVRIWHKRFDFDEWQISEEFLCQRHPPIETGIRLSLDAPYPEGHPLAEN
ncbi:pentapeptide repeat-containing protein [Amaricoccus sp. B4]|uniref:pentapeptide repeat-containing protein n=1 Tax=Amaricoccus sp. B4 TaxID=3368557 RepID=UPI0037177DBB